MINLTRSFEATIDDVKPGERSVVAKINTGAVDRYRTVILPQGADLEGYRRNPIVLWEHGQDPVRGTIPIGKNQWIKVDSRGIIAKTMFRDDPYSNEIFRCYQEDYLRGWSVRMVNPKYGPPTRDELRSNPGWSDCQNVFRTWEMGEYSATALPGNKDTLTILASRGIWIPDNLRAMTSSEGGLSGGGAAIKPNFGNDGDDGKRYIREENGKWCVYSEAGKRLGEYASKGEAEKRLEQIEYFKHEDKGRSLPTLISENGRWHIMEEDRLSMSFADEIIARECLRFMIQGQPIDVAREFTSAVEMIRSESADIKEMVRQYADLYYRGVV